ncbi:hypothetical protein L3X38_036421 [Prunus dulcis]|uniref:Uncharacterized protein n=1 Tax=Prunus dulcis TaxID=3755 RepID=A0AAD4V2Q7_PRUDU|nr:hypothetical protein L3X38_036421 [Prunus dulcis]
MAEMEAQVPGDGAEACVAMEVQEAEMGGSFPHIQVQQEAEQPESEKLPTPEDVDWCGVICKKLLSLLEDWKKSDIMPSRGQMNLPIIPNVIVAGDDECSATVEKEDMKGKGCRKKRLAQTLLSPFTDPSRKKRTMTVSDADATSPCFDPTKPLPIQDVKGVIEFCTAWKNDISAEVQLESCSAGPEFFYKLIDDTKWISSRHLDMETFLIRKRQLCHPMVFGTDWPTADYRLQVAIEIDFVRHTKTMYDSYIAFTSTSKLVKYLQPISDTLARVLHDMGFYEAFEVEQVKQKGMKMSTFTSFTVCSIGDVPQQRNWKLGKLRNWKIGKLEIGKSENWKRIQLAEMGNKKITVLDNLILLVN